MYPFLMNIFSAFCLSLLRRIEKEKCLKICFYLRVRTELLTLDMQEIPENVCDVVFCLGSLDSREELHLIKRDMIYMLVAQLNAPCRN